MAVIGVVNHYREFLLGRNPMQIGALWQEMYRSQYFEGGRVLTAAIASWNIQKSPRGYHAMFLLLLTGMLGVFVAMDLFLFYVFWEIMLLPMYFLIGVWGGPRKEYAAIKFFLYTLAGSVLMLLAMIAFYLNTQDPVTGGHTFNMLHMFDQANHSEWLNITNIRHILWIALFVGFAIKVPIFPFHTWLPDAHVEAPTAVSGQTRAIRSALGTTSPPASTTRTRSKSPLDA